MSPYDIVHLVLHASGDRVQGRTKLQKMVYFTGVLTGCLEILGYRPHFYGPYSSDVASAVDELLSLGFLEQRVCSSGAVTSDGFLKARYDYTLTADGRQIAEEKAHSQPIEWQRISDAVQLLKDSSDDYMRLSIAAKLYFLHGNQRGTASHEDVIALAPKFGWSVTPKQVSDAADLLQKFGLISLQAS